MAEKTFICIKVASENNLRNISLDIPHHKLIVVTGVSGSGKSSLAFDIIAREGQRRFYETFSSFSRQFMNKLAAPQVESIEGLAPVITLGQKTAGGNSRSTVGTLSDLYDHLRLLFARLGTSPSALDLSRSLFSFNSPKGACPQCTGLGLEEKISLKKLVAHPEKTLREGALAPTLPNGYIMYSQVTVEVLNQVCEAHGFSVDIPWKDLTKPQKEIILQGSNKIKVPFGKHSLESRLKWTGIAAKPREEGHYKGMIPIMSDILRRDRNKNILRYAESIQCTACQGSRLNESARSVKLKDKSIMDLTGIEITSLIAWLQSQKWEGRQQAIAEPVIEKMTRQIEMMERLGIGYLSLHRASNSLSGGEAQRIRLVNQVAAKLCNVLYVFDEPSIGLHTVENREMLRILRQLVLNGNTVIVVEHDWETICEADWIIDIGPGAGKEGGQLLFNGPWENFFQSDQLEKLSPTRQIMNWTWTRTTGLPARPLVFSGCHTHNLKNVTATFQQGALNVIIGKAGAGKSSLIYGEVERVVRQKLNGGLENLQDYPGLDQIDKLITINQKPIGRTPRSNPATYTGLADHIRDLFAKLPAAKASGFSKSRFSFNTKGGRCEECQGAGRIQIGMHLLGKVDLTCATCNGKRFNPKTLEIKFKGKSIYQIFEMRVDEALKFFQEQPKIMRYLQVLQDVGLGYLTLGQPSTTLSGGEAQRIKLASELQQTNTGKTLYLLDEPTIGLHVQDIQTLLQTFRKLIQKGNTIICIEHDFHFIRKADWLICLGPESGANGGEIVFTGTPTEFVKSKTPQSREITDFDSDKVEVFPIQPIPEILLKGVNTHLLKNIDVTFPRNKLTVITGVSGSGKSSLAFHTLFAEAQSRFSESLSTYTRSLLRHSNPAKLESSKGLGPVIAIGRKYLSTSPRSTVGTLTGLDALFRLFYSRLAQMQGHSYSAQNFSFNHQSGACPACNGLGFRQSCDPEKLFAQPEKSLLAGAFIKNRTGNYFGDPHGKFLAILKEVARLENIDLNLPWKELDAKARQIIMQGTGTKTYPLVWNFKNKTRSGQQNINEAWLGFTHYINDEYQRKQHNKNIKHLQELMREVFCETCSGQRLKPELLAIKWRNLSLFDLGKMSIASLKRLFLEQGKPSDMERSLRSALFPKILELIEVISDLGLSYLSPDRRSGSLSGGEGQRIRLARTFSARLYGVTYVLDEPSMGLHPKDVLPLLAIMRKLIATGNTLVVVEHNPNIILQADYIIEMGPGAGHLGGHINAQGRSKDFLKNPNSVTAPFLKPNLSPAIKPINSPENTSVFGIHNAQKHNLKGVDLKFRTGQLIALTGVSGSGKSTLLREVILPSARKGQPINCTKSFGFDRFDQVLFVDQKPIALHSQSSIATWSGLLDPLRNLFAKLPAAKAGSLKKSAFSYLSKDGMCPDCKGMGFQKTALDFLGDVSSECETCQGKRYQKQVLQVKWDGSSIADLLSLTLAEASQKLAAQPKMEASLNTLIKVGLGHLKLGQSCATLSGGEAQRLKLSRDLLLKGSNRNLYLMDEPTTGLHFLDVERLISLFGEMLAAGHSILAVSHHPMLISVANQLTVLGPGAGELGGNLIKNTIK